MNMYFIALVAPPGINQQVLEWKHWMKEHHQCVIALRSPAHITLVSPFWMLPGLENALINSLTEFAARQATFNVRLRNFSHFSTSVIFIDVVANDGLSVLQKELSLFLLNKDQYPLKQDKRSFHPHVTIATRDLHKKSFVEAWEHFKEKKYTAGWMVQDISLLKHNGKNWDIISSCPFSPV